MRAAKTDITEGVIWKQLLIFFFPILLGTFFQQLYNTVDAVVVGRFLGKESLAAVGGGTGTIINLLVGFFVGVSSGAAIVIAQFYGAKQRREIHRAVHTAIALSIVGGALIMILGLVFSPVILRQMGTPEAILGKALIYIRIFFAGMIPNLVYNMGAGILRAVGDSRRPFYYLIAGCLCNIILDLVFIAVLGMGVEGAAFATIISQLLSAVLVLHCLSHSEDIYRLNYRIIHFAPGMFKNMIRIGLPAGLQSVMYSLSNIIIQASVNQFGTDMIAAYTAYSKIDSLFWMTINAFGIAITTFAGQNFGAGKFDRIRSGMKQCLLIAGVVTVIISTLFYFFGEYIYLLFTTDEAVIADGMIILRFLVPVFITYICIEIISGTVRGTGDVFIPTVLTTVGVCVLRVVWIAVAVPYYTSIITVMASYPITWTTTSILFIIYYNKGSLLSRKLRQTS